MQTNIKKNEMQELLLLCIKNVHFIYNDVIYQQCDGVVMGSLLGPVVAMNLHIKSRTYIDSQVHLT